MNINWYPGHMKKTIEDIERKKLITDFCIEIIDARIPFSSSNPLLNEVIKGKKKLIIFNKSDLCDENMTSKWISHYKSRDINVLKYNATKPNVNAVIKSSMELMAEEIKKFEAQKEEVNKKYLLAGEKNNVDELMSLQEELDSLDNKILEKYQEWEETEEELKNIQ